jgi:hypothetical protein
MFWVFAMRQVTAVVGEVSVSEAAPETTLKLPLDVAAPLSPAASRAVTRMRPCVVVGAGEVQVQLCAVPGRPVHPAIGVKLVPPFEENETSMAVTPTASEAVHWMR